jgi:hypothetical protein
MHIEPPEGASKFRSGKRRRDITSAEEGPMDRRRAPRRSWNLTRTLAAAAAAAYLAAAGGCAGAKDAGGSSDEGAELSAVIGAVKQSIVEAETRSVRGFPPLKRVGLKLQTSVSRSVSGDVKYLVATAGLTTGTETVSTLDLVLTPSEIPPRRGVIETQLKDALAQAIQLARLGVAEAAKGDPPMDLTGVTIDLKFTVSVSGSAGASAKIQLIPLGVGTTLTTARDRHHEVHLVFGSSS